MFLLSGPPGSGKTHFLSLTILRYILIHQSVCPESPLRIFITAFTNAAIHNLLERIDELITRLEVTHILII